MRGFDIDAPEHTDDHRRKFWSSNWLAGFDGVRFVGAGAGKTFVREDNFGWTIYIHRHPGVIQFEQMTIVGAPWGGAVHAGTQNTQLELIPKFLVRLYECQVLAPGPRPDGGRSKWGLFGYNGDWHVRDVEIDVTEALEHGSYAHGYAKNGSFWQRVTVQGSGSQGDKTRSDNTETAYAGPDVWILRDDCVYKNSGQPWSARGPGFFVVEGGAANMRLRRNQYWGGREPGQSKAVMISSEALSYDILTGSVTSGFGNGYIVLRANDFRGYVPFDWNNEEIRVARNSGVQQAARGFLAENNGIWGERTLLRVNQVPAKFTLVRNNNTPAIRDRSGALGMDTTFETKIPTATRLIPVSEGIWQ